MFITIITPTFNSEKFISKNLSSVFSQKYRDLEHIFIDNNSTDRTKKILKEYKKKCNYKVKIISENDKGIYFAFNKGLINAKGDVITILNSDDYFSNKEVIKNTLKYFKKQKIDFIYGNIKILSRFNLKKKIRIWKSEQIFENEYYKVPHPSFMFRRSFQLKNKIKFDTTYKISADLDFIIQCFKKKKNYLYLNKFLVDQRSGGISQKLSGIILSNYEVYRILLKHKVSFKLLYIIKKLLFKICQLQRK